MGSLQIKKLMKLPEGERGGGGGVNINERQKNIIKNTKAMSSVKKKILPSFFSCYINTKKKLGGGCFEHHQCHQ
jgi:hypothetical protein